MPPSRCESSDSLWPILAAVPFLTLKNQKVSEVQTGPWVEYGVVVSVDANGVGRIKSHAHHDQVIFSIRGACHAVVKGGKARFESLFGKGAHAPAVGLEVAFIAGYHPDEKLAIGEVWCSKASWEKAIALRDAQPKQVVVPVKPHSHGGARKERSKTGRPVVTSKVVDFPSGNPTPASEPAVAIAN